MIADALPVAVAAPPVSPRQSLQALRWEHRVLLVFAGRANDPRLAAQRALTGEARTGFRERDLTIVEVVGDSVAGVRDYAPRLRGQYGVAGDAFAVVLIGKDGHAKLQSPAPVASDRIFATIDAMPMRQAELDQR